MIILEYFEKLLIRIGLFALQSRLFYLCCEESVSETGRLPGDIHIKRSNFNLWFPITSGLIASVIITGALGSGE